jgi:hypothetical protein
MTGTVADALVARLRTWGVPRVFGYAGDGVPLLVVMSQGRRCWAGFSNAGGPAC